MRIFLSLLVAATAVLAFHQEQVNEPTVFEAPRALSADGGRQILGRGGLNGRRVRGRRGRGRRGRGRRGLVSVEEVQDEAEETTRELTAAGRRRGGRRGGRRGRHGGRRGRGRRN
ncbi:hypothetical protein Ae201684_017978 [Aphanomyces euteiches]|uniref:RxLR effector protein n=1 Tax=Aphanomyces euteiches TaxID=100861 RepID=A0A6G0W6Z7_9STRA|nr:hypothetical protein Ae201684_017978 [Aphanomyces euteiches]